MKNTVPLMPGCSFERLDAGTWGCDKQMVKKWIDQKSD